MSPSLLLPPQAIDLVDEAAAKLKMEITSKPEALDVIDRQVWGVEEGWHRSMMPHLCPPHLSYLHLQVLQLEMERLSLGKAAKSDRTAAARLATLDSELSRLKSEQGKINKQWEGERSEMMKVKVRFWGGS